jgi:hypothetical protein
MERVTRDADRSIERQAVPIFVTARGYVHRLSGIERERRSKVEPLSGAQCAQQVKFVAPVVI